MVRHARTDLTSLRESAVTMNDPMHKTSTLVRARKGRKPEAEADEISRQLLIRRQPDEFRSLTDYVTATLKDTIIAHAMRPGTRLTEEGLARALGVSRLPVREALKALAAAGLVDQRPHGRGAAVSVPSKQLLAEVYQVRTALELLSTELAAQNITRAEIAELRTNVQGGLRAVRQRDWARAAELGSEFHRLLAAASRNSHLAELIESYDEKLRWANEPVSVDRGIAVWKEHKEIVDALASGDRKSAVACMRAHTAESSRSISQHGKDDAAIEAIHVGMTRCV